MNVDEWKRLEAEIWLISELNRAEENFVEGESIEEFAKEYKFGKYSEKEDINEEADFNFDSEILKELFDEGYFGDEFIIEFKRRKEKIAKVLDKMFNDIIVDAELDNKTLTLEELHNELQ